MILPNLPTVPVGDSDRPSRGLGHLCLKFLDNFVDAGQGSIYERTRRRVVTERPLIVPEGGLEVSKALLGVLAPIVVIAPIADALLQVRKQSGANMIEDILGLLVGKETDDLLIQESSVGCEYGQVVNAFNVAMTLHLGQQLQLVQSIYYVYI